MPAGPAPYAWQWLLLLDCMLNVLCGGYHAETFSAHCHRCNDAPFWGRAERVVNTLFWWQANHCERAFRWTCEMRGLPEVYRPDMRQQSL